MLLKANQRKDSDTSHLTSTDTGSVHSADAVLSSPGLTNTSPEPCITDSNINQTQQHFYQQLNLGMLQ